jgi:hypothetical protein
MQAKPNKRIPKVAKPNAPAKGKKGQNAANGVAPIKVRAKPPNPNPPHEATEQTRKMVMLCMALNYTHEQTARMVGISEPTLRKHYAKELAEGAEKMLAAVAGNLFTIATQQRDLKAALTGCIFIMKTRGGWRTRDGDLEAEVKAKQGEDGEQTMTFTLKIGERDGAEG